MPPPCVLYAYRRTGDPHVLWHLHGTHTAQVIYQGLRERADRTAVPMPFGDRGGLILRNE